MKYTAGDYADFVRWLDEQEDVTPTDWELSFLENALGWEEDYWPTEKQREVLRGMMRKYKWER